MSALPLENIRIVDLTHAWAGAYATCLLADMGAEVIKIEARKRGDGWRGPFQAGLRPGPPDAFLSGQKPYNRSPHFHGVNRNKFGITLDLDSPEGADIFRRLVKISQIVAENFSARVMGNFGFDYAALRQINPAIIMISMPGYGTTGPFKDLKSMGGTIEPMSGISSMTGYEGGPPMNHGVMYPDPVAGMMGACALLIAVHHQRRTGEGQFIDLSQQETASLLLGSALMDYSMNQRVAKPRGNHHDFMAPHQYFRCAKDRWIAISVSTDEEWTALVRQMGTPEWTRDKKFENALGRLEYEDELNRYLEGWTITQDRDELTRELQHHGIAAGPVLPFHEVMDNAHLRQRGYLEDMDYGPSGYYTTPGLAWTLSATPGRLERISPDLGQDSEEVLNRLLGISHQEYEALVEKGVTGQEPIIAGT